MSIRTTFLPTLLRSRPSPAFGARAFHFLPSSPPRPPGQTPTPTSVRHALRPERIVVKTRPAPRPKASQGSLLFTLGLGAAVIGVSSFQRAPARSEALSSTVGSKSITAPQPQVGAGSPPPAESILSVYQLSFGAVCGICTGVFVKKGLRAIAFLLGGVFVLLQYLNTKRFITVDWSKVAGRYDSAFGTQTATGVRAPTARGVWAWFVDFLTANFQQRASFMAGLVLGIRLG